MRISDWSSDVCSSDLNRSVKRHECLVERRSQTGRFCEGFRVALSALGETSDEFADQHRFTGVIDRFAVRANLFANPGKIKNIEHGGHVTQSICLTPTRKYSQPVMRVGIVAAQRSEERRVGQGCGSTGRYRWERDHDKQKRK